jgi:GNAT superfamily N-acetyltransferase
MNIQVRLASSSDFDSLCRLYVEFHEFHVQRVPDRLLTLGPPEQFDCSELKTNLTKIMKRGDAALFVAMMANDLIGLAEIYLHHDKPNEAAITRTYGYLQSLMVREPFRRQKIGRLLIQASESWAREKGATEVRLDIWEFAAGPLLFYENCGYRILRRTLVRTLS